ncbi:hypothetical protein D0Z03_002878 [Geotrichum reessii]|nr:hypothetical protein D0Z03_002878 [Galactomyces reessii]
MSNSLNIIDGNPRYDHDNDDDDDDLFEDALEDNNQQHQQNDDEDDDDDDENDDDEEDDDDEEEEDDDEDDDDDDERDDDEDERLRDSSKRPVSGYKTKPSSTKTVPTKGSDDEEAEESDEDSPINKQSQSNSIAAKSLPRSATGDKVVAGHKRSAPDDGYDDDKNKDDDRSNPSSKKSAAKTVPSARMNSTSSDSTVSVPASATTTVNDDDDLLKENSQPLDPITEVATINEVDATTNKYDNKDTKEPFVDIAEPEAPKGPKTFRQQYPITCDPSVQNCATYDIVPYTAAIHACPVYCVDVSWGMKWMFTGGQDGFIRRYNFFDSINNKLPLTVAQRHPFVDSITRSGVLTSYWENEQPVYENEIKLGKDGLYEPKLSPVYSMVVQSEAIWLLAGLEVGIDSDTISQKKC